MHMHMQTYSKTFKHQDKELVLDREHFLRDCAFDRVHEAKEKDRLQW